MTGTTVETSLCTYCNVCLFMLLQLSNRKYVVFLCFDIVGCTYKFMIGIFTIMLIFQKEQKCDIHKYV